MKIAHSKPHVFQNVLFPGDYRTFDNVCRDSSVIMKDSSVIMIKDKNNFYITGKVFYSSKCILRA